MIPIVGIDDGGFDLKDWKYARIYAVFMRGNSLIENISESRVPLDSSLSTDILIELLEYSPQLQNLQYIIHKGATIGGLGVLDMNEIYQKLKIPIVFFQEKPVDREVLRVTLLEKYPEQVEIYNSLPSQVYIEEMDVYAQFVGTTKDEVTELVRDTKLSSKLPEALRIAHMIGKSYYRSLKTSP